jgi:hypothetical protein
MARWAKSTLETFVLRKTAPSLTFAVELHRRKFQTGMFALVLQSYALGIPFPSLWKCSRTVPCLNRLAQTRPAEAVSMA